MGIRDLSNIYIYISLKSECGKVKSEIIMGPISFTLLREIFHKQESDILYDMLNYYYYYDYFGGGRGAVYFIYEVGGL